MAGWHDATDCEWLTTEPEEPEPSLELSGGAV